MQIKTDMKDVQYPESLILPLSLINISFNTQLMLNRTNTAIMLEGNRNGFLSLANMINVFNAYLYSSIEIDRFNFVKSSVGFSIVEDVSCALPNGIVIKSGESSYNWKLGETNLFVMTGLLHSLGYANDELHLDADLNVEDISVYCVVNNNVL